MAQGHGKEDPGAVVIMGVSQEEEDTPEKEPESSAYLHSLLRLCVGALGAIVLIFVLIQVY